MDATGSPHSAAPAVVANKNDGPSSCQWCQRCFTTTPRIACAVKANMGLAGWFTGPCGPMRGLADPNIPRPLALVLPGGPGGGGGEGGGGCRHPRFPPTFSSPWGAAAPRFPACVSPSWEGGGGCRPPDPPLALVLPGGGYRPRDCPLALVPPGGGYISVGFTGELRDLARAEHVLACSPNATLQKHRRQES